MIPRRRLKVVVALAAFGVIAAPYLWTSSGLAQTGTTGTQARLRKQSEEIARRQERGYGYKGVVSGRVLLSDRRPAEGFIVMARFTHHHTGMAGEGFAVTDAKGFYRIHGLVTRGFIKNTDPQDFRVTVETSDTPYFEPPSRVVSLNDGLEAKVEKLDFALTLGPQITVRARNARTGQPLSGIEVRANNTSHNSPRLIGSTDTKGEFRFRTNQLYTSVYLNAKKGDSTQEASGLSGFNEIRFTSVAEAKDTLWDFNAHIDTNDAVENWAVFYTQAPPERKTPLLRQY